MIIYIAFGLFIFEKRTQQITTYLSKILQIKHKTTLTFFEKPGPGKLNNHQENISKVSN